MNDGKLGAILLNDGDKKGGNNRLTKAFILGRGGSKAQATKPGETLQPLAQR